MKNFWNGLVLGSKSGLVATSTGGIFFATSASFLTIFHNSSTDIASVFCGLILYIALFAVPVGMISGAFVGGIVFSVNVLRSTQLIGATIGSFLGIGLVNLFLITDTSNADVYNRFLMLFGGIAGGIGGISGGYYFDLFKGYLFKG